LDALEPMFSTASMLSMMPYSIMFDTDNASASDFTSNASALPWFRGANFIETKI
jgi:hypothetical protein